MDSSTHPLCMDFQRRRDFRLSLLGKYQPTLTPPFATLQAECWTNAKTFEYTPVNGTGDHICIARIKHLSPPISPLRARSSLVRTSSSEQPDKPATTASCRKSVCQLHGNKFPGIEFQQLKSFILNRRRFGAQDETMLGMQLGRHFHQAASGQALQQRAETADGVAIVGFLAVGFMFGTVSDLRVFD